MNFDTLDRLVATFVGHGERTAIIHCRADDREVVSYTELAARIHAGARGLRARGIGPGDRVALWAPNSSDWVAAYFAVISAGATAVPIDHQGTTDSTAAALRHATPRALLTTVARATALTAAAEAGAGLDIVLLDGAGTTSWRALLESAPPLDLPTVPSDAVASLLFTSGTTGTPKAVPLTHANLAANAGALTAAALVGSDDRVLLPLPLHHTYPFTVGLLTVLAQGATVVLPAGLSGPEIARAATTTGATALLAVPRLCAALWDSVQAAVRARSRWQQALFAVLLEVSITVRRLTGAHLGRWLFRSVHERLGRNLTVIGCGGAQLPTALAWQLEGLGWTVLTGYGLTETSPVLTFNDRRHSRLGSEGRPLSGVQLRIAPTSGEIEARGRSVFAGYWQNAAATAATFTADGWFRTGDLGRVDSHGYLYVVGRSKELIVLPDGKKLFPETIEALYATSPLLREIAIFELDGHLVGLLVPEEQAVLERGALREAALLREEIEDVAARLPPYQRLASYRVTRTPLPRTQLGKLKRHMLPALFAGAAEGAPPPGEPTISESDRELIGSGRSQAAWDWLKQRYADRPLTLDTSPQLDLKIDSLEWVTLTIEIERRFGVALNDAALSRILTLRDLLREIEAAPPASAHEDDAAPPFEPPGTVLRALGAAIFAVLRPCVRLLWRLEVEGAAALPRQGPLLIAPNHTSYLDPLALVAALPWRQLRRTYWAGWVGILYTSPIRRLLSRATQVFPVDPDRDLGAALRAAQRLLAEGHCVVWFPEGRRSPTGRLEPFQAGVGRLLTDGVTAVPTAIVGTFAAWPKQRRWPRLAPLRVRFGAPQTFAASQQDADRRLALERAVRALLDPSAGTVSPLPRPSIGVTAMPTAPSLTTDATLRDGRRVSIRPIRRDDVVRNAAFLDALSPPSKHFLFLGGIGTLSDAALQRLCDPDYAHDMAFIALAPDPTASGTGRQVGICRYAGAADATGAEISVAVADDWQHQGLGQLLLQRLIDYARAHGVARLYSMDAAGNERMRRLARRLGFIEQPDPDDIHQVIYSLQLQ